MRSRWITWEDGGLRIPLLGLTAALLAVATVLTVLGYRNWDLSDRNHDLAGSLADYRRREADCTAAITAGTDFLVAANNFDYRKPDDWTPRMAALSAGPIHDYFATPKVAQDNSELIKAGKLRKSATVADAACSAQTGKGIRIIAQLTETTENFQTTAPVKTVSAVWVELGRQDSGWKAIDSGRGDQALTADLTAAPAPGPTPSAAPETPR